nr:hypothetical protein [Saprospiraceae bacterium]
ITVGNDFNRNLNDFLLPYFSKNFSLNKNLNFEYKLNLTDSIKVKYPVKLSETNYYHIGYIPHNISKLKNDDELYILLNRSIEMRHHKLAYYKLSIERSKSILKIIEEGNYIGE